MRNRYIAISVLVTALLTVAIITAFAVFATGGEQQGSQAASITVAVLQIASVMVVATLALSRARTRAFGWESIAAAIVLTAFVIIAGGWGVDGGVSMVMRPPIGLVGILAFTLFDRGVPVTRIDRLVTVPASLIGIGLGIVIGLTATVTPGAWAALPCGATCRPYGLGLVDSPTWSTSLQVLFAIVQATAMGACIVGLAQRLRGAQGWRRIVMRPIAWFGVAYAGLGLMLMVPVFSGIATTLPAWVEPVLILRRLLLPLGVVAGMLLATILQRQAARTGLSTLRDAASTTEVEDVVQRLLGDPDVRLLPADASGAPRTGFSRTGLQAPDGDVLGVLEYRPAEDEEEEQALEVAAPAAALALDLLRTQEWLANASAAERARIERDLHDGVQQHLISMRMRLSLLEARLENAPEATRDDLDELVMQTEVALDELRSIARGEHLGLLAREGLHHALEQVAASSGRDVRLGGVTDERLPPAIEEAIYFTCREALQNALKHGGGHAPLIITAHVQGTEVVFEISDIGDNRAPEAPVATPRTIAERVAGFGGTVATFSSASGGRRITGRIPLVRIHAEAEDAV